MSPDFLLDSAKREVIFKTPEVKSNLFFFLILFFWIKRLKIPILKDLKRLLKDSEKPFVAGFGNRESVLFDF